MKIVLVGYMASGKSVIANRLAKSIDIGYLDLDNYIETKENLKINEIFSIKGEITFRLLENKYLEEILNSKKQFVLAVGGGTPCYANNMNLIIEKSNSIFLKASIQTLFDRLVNEKKHRPLISSISDNKLKEYIAKHLFERNIFYEQAKNIIKVDKKDIEQVVKELQELI